MGDEPLVLMEEMTSKEIRDRVAAGFRTAIIPMGSIEAHGEHLPINTDSVVSRRLSELVAKRLGKALVAHTLPFGHAPRTQFAGTISIPVETVLDVLRAYLGALHRDGFDTVVLIPMHAENFQTLALFSPMLAMEFPDMKLIPSLDVASMIESRNAIAAEHEITSEEAGWHAGAAETSEMLAIDPDLVRMPDAHRGYLGPSGFGRSLPETMRDGWAVLDPHGVMGDPTRSTPEFGRDVLNRLADDLASLARGATESKEAE
ncbi:MAG TPA: creatininase family protein [Candidatus Micrarchaeaceae archaeon]|nr:creatininase family protein [Candidatus Micrarchaeaceae archaeon]